MSSTETPEPGGERTSDPTEPPERDALLEPVSRRVAAVWNVVFWYVAQILVLARNIVLVPVFLRYIGEEEYNAWLVSGFVLAQLTSVDFGVMAVLGQRVAAAYGERQRERLERLVGGGLLTVCVLAGVIGVATAAVSPWVPGLFDVTPQIAERLTACFLFVAVANAIQLLGFAASGLLRAFQRAFLPGLFMVLAEAAALTTTAVLVIRGWGLYAIAAGLVARAAVQAGGSGAALCWVGLGKLRLRPVWDGGEARTLWRLSSYQFLAQIAGRFKQSFDASLLGVMLGTEAGGSYSLTIRAHESVRMLAAGVVGAATPGMAHMHGEGAPGRLKGVALTLFKVQALLGAIGFGGVIAFNAAFMRLWVGPELFSGQAVSVMAALAAITWLLSTTPYETVMARGGFATITRVVWLDVVLRFSAMAVLVRWIGVLGTPVASLVCQVLAVLVPLGWVVAGALRVSRDELLATLAGSLKLMLLPLTLAAVVAYALPPASSWALLVAEAAVYLALCALGTWLLDRELVRFALRGGREHPTPAV